MFFSSVSNNDDISNLNRFLSCSSYILYFLLVGRADWAGQRDQQRVTIHHRPSIKTLHFPKNARHLPVCANQEAAAVLTESFVYSLSPLVAFFNVSVSYCEWSVRLLLGWETNVIIRFFEGEKRSVKKWLLLLVHSSIRHLPSLTVLDNNDVHKTLVAHWSVSQWLGRATYRRFSLCMMECLLFLYLSKLLSDHVIYNISFVYQLR